MMTFRKCIIQIFDNQDFQKLLVDHNQSVTRTNIELLNTHEAKKLVITDLTQKTK